MAERRQVGGGRVGGQDAEGHDGCGRQDGQRADDGLGLGLAAGFGVPLVAVICHSADPLLVGGTVDCAGRDMVAPGRRDSPINHIGARAQPIPDHAVRRGPGHAGTTRLSVNT